jgi:ribosomal protein S18 acetylase RimI-like enzyme
MMTIRPLTDDDLPEFVRLRQRALVEKPLAFLASPENDAGSNLESLRSHLALAPEYLLYGAFDEMLVGSAGIMRGRKPKAAHKVHLFSMYVRPERRGAGIAAALLEAAIAHARTIAGVEWIELGVTSSATAAQRLYERAGFRAWGVEPDAIRHEGASADDIHMSLRL